MFDATKLLGEFMHNQAAPSAPGRLSTAVAQSGGDGGTLGSLASLLGGNTAPGGAGLSGLLGQLAGGLQQAAGTARTQVEGNNPVAIGGLGALAGAILGGGKGAVGGGLMAVLGSMAVSALQKSTAAPAPTAPAAAPASYAPPAAAVATPPARPAAIPDTHAAAQANAMLLLRAMISAAKADGQVDGQEMANIMGKLKEAGSDPAAQQFVLQELGKPVDIPGLAAATAGSPELAVQVYAASLLAIEVDTPAEQFYLTSLAQALGLQPETVTQIHQAMGLSA